jgi:multiple sugar transport system permease protein
VLFRTLDVLRIYDLPAILTNGGGGTTSLSMLVIKQIRGGFHSASALSTIVFLLIAFTAFLFIKFGGADVVQRPPKAKKKEPEAAVGNPVAANATSTGA